jgi:hypothetical protein
MSRGLRATNVIRKSSMRRLGLLSLRRKLFVNFVILVIPACVRDNPAFDACETEASCVDESGNASNGEGDPGDGDTGDGDTGDGDGDDGDGDPGDGDPGDGDPGDGDPGDGDGETTGDGDGDLPELPACPDSLWVDIPVLQDTFLDGSEDQGPNCIVDWDFDANIPKNSDNLSECGILDFGASIAHWACSGGTCNSVWLGKFDLAPWMQMPVQVQEAHLEFTVKFQTVEPTTALAYELDVSGVDFGNCLEWQAGDGQGEAPTDCDTTFIHSAHPNTWGTPPNNQLFQVIPIGAAQLPASGDQVAQQAIMISVNHTLVQNWLSGQPEHHGVLLNSNAWLPKEFYLFAQGSGKDPKLKVRLCEP